MVAIVGIETSNWGCFCEEHDVCNVVLHDDSGCRLLGLKTSRKRKEDAELDVYYVLEGLRQLDGALRQTAEFYMSQDESPTKRNKHNQNVGGAVAAIIFTTISFDINHNNTKHCHINPPLKNQKPNCKTKKN